MIKTAFCSLDAKGDNYTGYSPAGFYDESRDCPAYLTPELGRLSIMLNREYLTRLAALQDELAEKYEVLAALPSIEPLPKEPWGNGLNREDYEATKAHAKVQFPGREAEYYT